MTIKNKQASVPLYRPHPNRSVQFLSGEAHHYKRQRRQTIERPLSKAEVVYEAVDVSWNDVE